MRHLLERLETMHRGDKTSSREYRMIEKALQREFMRKKTPWGEVVYIDMIYTGTSGMMGKVQAHSSPIGAGLSFGFEDWDSTDPNSDEDVETTTGILMFGRQPLGSDSVDFDAKFKTPDRKVISGKVRQDNVESDLIAFMKGVFTRARRKS